MIKQSEQEDLQSLIEPALRGLTRSGATILLISVVPGGFLLHLSSGIVINLAHGYVWDKGNENKETILATMKNCLGSLQNGLPELRRIPAPAKNSGSIPDFTNAPLATESIPTKP